MATGWQRSILHVFKALPTSREKASFPFSIPPSNVWFGVGWGMRRPGVLIVLFSEWYRISQKYLNNFVVDLQPHLFVFNFNIILSRLKVALSKD